MLKKADNLAQDIPEAKKSRKGVVFLGGDCSDNAWRESIKDKFKDRFVFLDPYEEDWDPEKDIYNELAGLVVADYVVFYNGAEGSDREKKFLDMLDKEYQEFNDIDKLIAYIDGLGPPTRGLAHLLRKTANLMAIGAF